jgi:hypothetical protein
MVTPFFQFEKLRGAGSALGSGWNRDFSIQIAQLLFGTRGARQETAVADNRPH